MRTYRVTYGKEQFELVADSCGIVRQAPSRGAWALGREVGLVISYYKALGCPIELQASDGSWTVV